jgi:hypothetical protein
MWWLALGSLAALGFILLSAALRIRRLDSIREMLMSVIAASLGVWKSLRGERFQTWNIAASSRLQRPG